MSALTTVALKTGATKGEAIYSLTIYFDLEFLAFLSFSLYTNIIESKPFVFGKEH